MKKVFSPLGVAALNERMVQVLEAIVNEYISSAEPVGSRVLTRRHGVEFSPATVRNVMSDLEELGLLTQPHTSAGRVPTDRGLRYFIDTILKIRRLTTRERETIRSLTMLLNLLGFWRCENILGRLASNNDEGEKRRMKMVRTLSIVVAATAMASRDPTDFDAPHAIGVSP